MTEPTRILVVRHGESIWNAEGRWQGQADPPLSATGESQALLAAGVISHLDIFPRFDEIVASDLQRAALTATLIADELGHGPVALDQRLRERHAGSLQGLTRAEVEVQYPGYLSRGELPPGLEAPEPAAARAFAALHDIARRLPGAHVLVVSHGGILRAMRTVLAIHGDFGFANLSGQWFEFDGPSITPGDLVSLLPAERPEAASPL